MAIYHSTPDEIAGLIPQPVVDFPHATTRLAVSLVYSGVIKRYPNVKIILSHGGGTLPYLIDRACMAALAPHIAQKGKLVYDEVRRDFGR